MLLEIIQNVITFSLSIIIIIIFLYYFFGLYEILNVDQFYDEHNVHQPEIRSVIWDKFYILREKAKNVYNLEKNSMEEAFQWAQQKNYRVLILLGRISENETILATNGQIYGEKEIFSLVWWRFATKKYDLNILLQNMLDCFNEDGDLWCLTGRISRYINALAEIDEDKELSKVSLGEKEIFAEALRELSCVYKEILEQDQRYRMALEQKNEFFISQREKKYKNILRKYFEKKYKLPESKIDELLLAF